MRQVLLDAKTGADTARHHEQNAIDADTLAGIEEAYNTVLHQAMATISGEPNSKAERAATNLACALFDYQTEILAFTRNLNIPFDNYADVRVMPMLTDRAWSQGAGGLMCSA